MQAYIPTCMHVYILHTRMNSSIPPYIHPYIHSMYLYLCAYMSVFILVLAVADLLLLLLLQIFGRLHTDFIEQPGILDRVDRAASRAEYFGPSKGLINYEYYSIEFFMEFFITTMLFITESPIVKALIHY